MVRVSTFIKTLSQNYEIIEEPVKKKKSGKKKKPVLEKRVQTQPIPQEHQSTASFDHSKFVDYVQKSVMAIALFAAGIFSLFAAGAAVYSIGSSSDKKETNKASAEKLEENLEKKVDNMPDLDEIYPSGYFDSRQAYDVTKYSIAKKDDVYWILLNVYNLAGIKPGEEGYADQMAIPMIGHSKKELVSLCEDLKKFRLEVFARPRKSYKTKEGVYRYVFDYIPWEFNPATQIKIDDENMFSDKNVTRLFCLQPKTSSQHKKSH